MPYRVFREVDPVTRPGELELVSEHTTEAEATAVATALPVPCTIEKADGGSSIILAVGV